MNKTQNTETEVEETTTTTTVSPIQVAKDADVRPQMVYNYIKKGYIEHVIEDGKIRVPAEVASEWVEKYTNRKAERVAKKAAEIQAQLAGE